MFKITRNKGFHMTFENGWTVSVQFGAGNYCDNYDHSSYSGEVPPSTNAEVAAWDEDGNMLSLENGYEVSGWVSADDVAEFIAMVKGKP